MKMFVADSLVEKLEAEVKKLYMRGHVAAEHHVREHALNIVKAEPTVDAEPVRHGRVVWKNRFMGGFVPDITITDRAGEKHTGTLDTTHYEPVPYCSECGKELGVSSLAYCPNCGAKMDGGAE